MRTSEEIYHRVRWDPRFDPARFVLGVNVRGVRMELGEIEAALRAHESIADAVAVVDQHPIAGERLVVFGDHHDAVFEQACEQAPENHRVGDVRHVEFVKAQ